MLSLLEFGLIFNVVGLFSSLLLSAGVVCVYRRPFFLYWTAAYILAAPSLAMLTLGQLGRASGLVLVLGALGMVGYGVLVAQTAAAIEERPFPRALGWAGLILAAGASATILSSGPWQVLHVLMVAWCSLCYGLLGLTLWRLETPVRGWTRQALVVLTLGTAGWCWTSIGLLPTPFFWAGFVVAGLLQSFLGLVMAIFLLELQASTLQSTNVELKQLDQRKSNFIATVNHELRTPLTVIQGSADLLEDGLVGPLTPEQSRLLRTITRQVHQLGTLIHDMLDFSNLHFTQRPPELVPDDLAALTRQVVEGFAGPYEEKGVTLDLRLEGEVAPCQLDRSQMIRVLTNMLGNALKFTPSGGRVTLTLRQEGASALITVADTGVGLDPEDLGRLFTRFYQGRRAAEGTGLGLAICRGIVEENHHGRIWVESRPGEGATFHVRLPLEPPGTPASPLSITA